MGTLKRVWPLVVAVIPITSACEELSTSDSGSNEAVTPGAEAAVAGGPVTISRGEVEYPIYGYTTGCSGEWFLVNGNVTYRYQVTSIPAETGC